MRDSRDYDIILRMIDHCNRIQEIKERFGDDYKRFSQDYAYQDSINMNLFQIGELSNQLSEVFRSSHPEIPWHKIYGARNIIAHAYVIVDMETIWLTIEKDIPAFLKQLRLFSHGQ